MNKIFIKTINSNGQILETTGIVNISHQNKNSIKVNVNDVVIFHPSVFENFNLLGRLIHIDEPKTHSFNPNIFYIQHGNVCTLHKRKDFRVFNGDVLDLGFEVRTNNGLRSMGIHKIKELLFHTELEFRKKANSAPNFGKKSLDEIFDFLLKNNLKFR